MKVGIIGATGYTGLSLLRDLAGRPSTEVTLVTSRKEAGGKLIKIHPSLAGYPGYRELILEDPNLLEKIKEKEPARFPEVIFLAVKHKAAMALAPRVLNLGSKVIDLTGDFRLKEKELYPKWYKFEHECPEYLSQAIYGLPELHRDKIKNARLVANPGCYPTSVILALAPLCQEGLIRQGTTIMVDSKSGVSGAGREPSLGNIFCEVSENFRAYKVVGHQHTPEMAQELSFLAKGRISLSFTPHLVPMNRGICTTTYVLVQKVSGLSQITEIYQDYYKNEPFVRLKEQGQIPETLDVRGTNFCDLGLFYDEDEDVVKIISVIDNLCRGASTQAMVNLNILSGAEENLGVNLVALRP
ncbi:MAG: N-acetyl-gamma-glutamyl-phosphate reductase [Deltaproteobacteria bacterium]|jgi:N-acetyl-gamma-glutamyl-phosphate reductase|nr:N-acetyl-gamma-glutamyl-phosphate reductase [Deltaproteobacteria bacterium]